MDGPSGSLRVMLASTTTGVDTTLSPSVQPVLPGVPVITGASLTAVTTTDAVSVPVENAEVPPKLVASSLVPWPPCVPLVWSQAR